MTPSGAALRCWPRACRDGSTTMPRSAERRPLGCAGDDCLIPLPAAPDRPALPEWPAVKSSNARPGELRAGVGLRWLSPGHDRDNAVETEAEDEDTTYQDQLQQLLPQ